MSAGGADEYLIDGVRRGDERSWRALVERYSGRLLAFARSRSGGRGDAEDLVQETLIGFLQSVDRFDSSRSLETYLFAILRYKLYDSLRQRKNVVIGEPEDGIPWWDRAAPESTETPSAAAVQAELVVEQTSILAGLLRRLIHEFRDRGAFTDLQVIELLFFKGDRNLEVAQMLELDQKVVAGIKFRAIQKLQKYMTDDASGSSPVIPDGGAAEVTVARVWRDERLTCLKRGTLGAYLLGVLDEPWHSYTQFHLDVVGCPLCVANLQDIEAEQVEQRVPDEADRLFQSSVGFLSRVG